MTQPPNDHDLPDSARGVTRDIASRVASAKRERDLEAQKASGQSPADRQGMARGMRMGSEFVAAILVGAGLGYLIDLGLGSMPWGLIIFLMIGFVAGVRNVARVATEMNAASSADANAGSADRKQHD